MNLSQCASHKCASLKKSVQWGLSEHQESADKCVSMGEEYTRFFFLEVEWGV